MIQHKRTQNLGVELRIVITTNPQCLAAAVVCSVQSVPLRLLQGPLCPKNHPTVGIPKIRRILIFCVGCFELIISKIVATPSEMGKKYFDFAIFLRNPFLRRVLHQKLLFVRGLGLIHFVATARDRTLDSGIAVHSYTGIQMWISWTLRLQSIAQISTNKHDSGLPGGGGGQQAVGQTQHPSRDSGILAKRGGRGKKQFMFAIFFAEPIFA